VVILDNSGKRIYAKYFVPEESYLYEASAQKEFEKKLGQTVLNLNVAKNEESKNLKFK
jgi:hypothetical protein